MVKVTIRSEQQLNCEYFTSRQCPLAVPGSHPNMCHLMDRLNLRTGATGSP